MLELTPQEFEKIRPLVLSIDDHLAIYGILSGAVPARVYVDDPEQPQAAFVRAGQRYYLLGACDNPRFNQELRQLFFEHIYPQERQNGSVMFMLYYAPEAWEGVIPQILSGKFPIRTRRQYYEFRNPRPDWRTLLPDGFSMVFIDHDFLQTYPQLNHMHDLLEEMCSERPSVEDFLEKSFGVCLVNGDDLAGWCLSEYNQPGRCEIGIASMQPYQRRGLATLMTGSFVEYALFSGVTRIGWHCYSDNLPSVATALKAGFVKVSDYPAFFAWFNEVENLGVHGNRCLGEKHYDEALEWFEKAFALGEAPGWVWWCAALAAAMLERSPEAFAYLDQSINRGFPDRQRLQNSQQLASLHGSEEWSRLLERLG